MTFLHNNIHLTHSSTNCLHVTETYKSRMYLWNTKKYPFVYYILSKLNVTRLKGKIQMGIP